MAAKSFFQGRETNDRLKRDQMHVQARATSCDIARNITRNITHSFARNIKPQHHAREKLTGEIVKHDAELAHQSLRLSRGTDVFTISSGGRGVSVYLACFYASGPPVVKLDDTQPMLSSCSVRTTLRSLRNALAATIPLTDVLLGFMTCSLRS